MTLPITVNVRLRGGLFTKDLDQVVKNALVSEALDKIDVRVHRGGKGLGARRNTITDTRSGLVLTESSTLFYPRTRGTSWVRKNIAIIRAMAPRVIRKAAERIASEVG